MELEKEGSPLKFSKCNRETRIVSFTMQAGPSVPQLNEKMQFNFLYLQLILWLRGYHQYQGFPVEKKRQSE